MGKRIIQWGMAILAIFNVDLSATDTPADRSEFYKLENRSPSKELIAVQGDLIYTLNPQSLCVSVQNVRELGIKKELLRLPQEGRCPTKFLALSEDYLCIQSGLPENQGHRTSVVHVFNVRTQSDFAITDQGSVYVQAVHPTEPVLYIGSHRDGVKRCLAYNWITAAQSTICEGVELGTPLFGSDGLRYWINRPHYGEQTVHKVMPDGTFEVVYRKNDSRTALVGFDVETETVLEVCHNAETKRWLPWISKRTKWENSQKCVLPDCVGSVTHFHYTENGFCFFNIFNSVATSYVLKESQNPTPFERNIACALKALGGKKVIKGPEFEQLIKLTRWNLVAEEADGSLGVMCVERVGNPVMRLIERLMHGTEMVTRSCGPLNL